MQFDGSLKAFLFWKKKKKSYFQVTYVNLSAKSGGRC